MQCNYYFPILDLLKSRAKLLITTLSRRLGQKMQVFRFWCWISLVKGVEGGNGGGEGDVIRGIMYRGVNGRDVIVFALIAIFW